MWCPFSAIKISQGIFHQKLSESNNFASACIVLGIPLQFIRLRCRYLHLNNSQKVHLAPLQDAFPPLPQGRRQGQNEVPGEWPNCVNWQERQLAQMCVQSNISHCLSYQCSHGPGAKHTRYAGGFSAFQNFIQFLITRLASSSCLNLGCITPSKAKWDDNPISICVFVSHYSCYNTFIIRMPEKMQSSGSSN